MSQLASPSSIYICLSCMRTQHSPSSISALVHDLLILFLGLISGTMGTLVGHVAPGLGFLLIGLWHLFNNTKLHAQRPNSYVSSPWFPFPAARHLELYLIMAGSFASISMELFIAPHRHQPLDPDGTIPSNHLHNFEHASISLSLFTYAAFALVFDRLRPRGAHEALTQLLAALAFAQELLLFRLHSTDHLSVEGQYHTLLQLLILVSMVTTLMGIRHPESFLTAFVRSLSIVFQGVWFIVLGVMIWTPSLVPKGCWLNDEDGRLIERCEDEEALGRAKALANLEFCWFLVGISIFGVVSFLVAAKRYSTHEGAVYKVAREEGVGGDDHEETKSFLQTGIISVATTKDMER